MSGSGGGFQAKSNARPPELGAFPLDHDGECKAAMKVYMECLKNHGNDNFACKHLSREYLRCRMDRELMKPDDLKKLGFTESEQAGATRPLSVVDVEGRRQSEIIAGLHIEKTDSFTSRWFNGRSRPPGH